MKHLDKLKSLNACEEVYDWAATQSSMKDVWNNCERGDWLLWLLDKVEYSDFVKLRLIAVACARKAQHLMTDERSINALDVAEAFAKGEATESELNLAWVAAWYAYCDADGAAWAARAAAAAADATVGGSGAAAEATDEAADSEARAAAAAADASWDASWDARADARLEQCKIIRGFISWEEVEICLKGESK